MPPTCYLSALLDHRAIHSTSKHGLEKEELTQQVAWLAKSKQKEARLIAVNPCG